MVPPGGESKSGVFGLSLQKKFRGQLTRFPSEKKEGLIRAADPVFMCREINPKETKDLVMFSIGLFTRGKKCKLRCPTIRD